MQKKQQLHKRLDVVFIKEIFSEYIAGSISLTNALSELSLSRSRFYKYLKKYKENPEGFSISYKRKTANRRYTEREIKIMEFCIQEEFRLLHKYSGVVLAVNFVALSIDIFDEYTLKVSPETLRQKAIKMKLHNVSTKKQKIFREVKTSKIGRLFQHDTCIHKWSPFMEKFYLILTIDDASRVIVGARFAHKETTMEHILEVEWVCRNYGIPLAWYTDKHSIFTYTERNSPHRNFQTLVEDAQVQWKRVMQQLKVKHILANSPQAKGKVERVFLYLQGRLTRRCAKARITTIDDAQKILDLEIEYYNKHRIHSSLKKIPWEYWNNAKENGQNLLRNFSCLDQKEENIFCLEYNKKLNSYGKTILKGQEIICKKTPSKNVIIRFREVYGEKEYRIFAHNSIIQSFSI